VQLETEDTTGHVIHAVQLDDSSRTFLVTVSNAVTGEVTLISDHMDMEGMAGMVPRGGGELPEPPVPDPTSNAPIAYRLAGGGSGSPVVNGYTLLWDAANERVVGPVFMSGVSYDYMNVMFVRSQSYLVTRGVHDKGVKVNVWDIDSMVDRPAFSHYPVRTITVFEDDVFDPVLTPLFVGRDDTLWVCADLDPDGSHDYRLFHVNLVTSEVTSKEITGLPADCYFRTSDYGCDAIDVNGYLWAMVNDSGDHKVV